MTYLPTDLKIQIAIKPILVSLYLFFSPPHNFMSSVQYQWNTCNSGMCHHWYVSKQWLYKFSGRWKVRAESQYFSPCFKHPHTPIKKKNPSSSGFLIIFYNFFPFNIQNIHMLFWRVKKAYLVHIQNFGKASFFSHIWSGWYWKICFLWGSCSFSTYFFLIVKCGLKGHFKSQWQNFLQLWNCL